MIRKSGTAHWSGGFKDGGGTVSTETGALKDAAYGATARFEGGPGTNPEELIGAAHAACFAMALSVGLGAEGLTANSIDAKSTVGLAKIDGGFEIQTVHLDLVAKVPGASADQFARIAEATKVGCPVSRVLKGATISLTAKLE